VNSSFPADEHTGSLLGLAPVKVHLVAPETWFDYRIRCEEEKEGTRIRISIDGVVITDYLDQRAAVREGPDRARAAPRRLDRRGEGARDPEARVTGDTRGSRSADARPRLPLPDGSTPIRHPGTPAVSPQVLDGRWELSVDRARATAVDRDATGCTHDGKEAWKAEKPWTFWDALVTEDGFVAGYSYSERGLMRMAGGPVPCGDPARTGP
jgi:hypothetical protein